MVNFKLMQVKCSLMMVKCVYDHKQHGYHTSPRPELREAQTTPVYVTALESEKETIIKLPAASIVTTIT